MRPKTAHRRARAGRRRCRRSSRRRRPRPSARRRSRSRSPSRACRTPLPEVPGQHRARRRSRSRSVVYAIRSEHAHQTAAAARGPSTTSDTPSMTASPVPELAPDTPGGRRGAIATDASTRRRRRSPRRAARAGCGSRWRSSSRSRATRRRRRPRASAARRARRRSRGCARVTANSIWSPRPRRGGERARHHGDHPERDERPEQGADGGGRQVVRDAFEHEHLDEVPAPRPDRRGRSRARFAARRRASRRSGRSAGCPPRSRTSRTS